MSRMFEQLRRDTAKSMKAVTLSISPISIDVGGLKMKEFNEFERCRQKRKVLEQFFVQIRGIGITRASDIVTCILTLPKDKRIEFAHLIEKGID